MDEQVYWVFARREAGAPLSHIGLVSAPSAALASIYARANYTERPWIDIRVAPCSAFSSADDLTRAAGPTAT
jgi:1,2-phenylacetyl-CoA epoxidase PaaB subunit